VQGLVDEVPEELRKLYKTVWEVPQRSIIDHAAARAPFVDQSQSMNLYFGQPNFQKLSSAIMYAWGRGLKTGCYYLRSRPAVEAIKVSLTGGGLSGMLGSLQNSTAARDDATAAGPACRRGNDGCISCGA
jgi:ribonucleoside-diphosphate reductase subunit M1